MTDDRCQTEEENKAIELKGFDRNSGGSLALESFQIQNTKTKHSCHTTVGHKKGKISTRQKEIDEKRSRKKAEPHEDIRVQRLNCDALFRSLFAIVFIGPGLFICDLSLRQGGNGENSNVISETCSEN